MKGNYEAIAKSAHFSIVINSTSRRCLEIVIDWKGKVANLAKVLLIVDYGIVENIKIPSLTSATLYVRSQFFFGLCEEIFTIGALSDGVRSDHFVSRIKISWKCHVHFWSKITLDWFAYVFRRLVNNVNRLQIFFSYCCNSFLTYSYPLNFCMAQADISAWSLFLESLFFLGWYLYLLLRS